MKNKESFGSRTPTDSLNVTIRLENKEQKRRLLNDAKENGYENLIPSYIRYKLGLKEIGTKHRASLDDRLLIAFPFDNIEEKSNTIAEAKKWGYKTLSSYVLSMLGAGFERKEKPFFFFKNVSPEQKKALQDAATANGYNTVSDYIAGTLGLLD